jgi:hypothetical protein
MDVRCQTVSLGSRGRRIRMLFYPPSQNTTGMPVDECLNIRSLLRRDATPWKKANTRGAAEGQDGYVYGITGYPVGAHFKLFSPSPRVINTNAEALETHKLVY